MSKCRCLVTIAGQTRCQHAQHEKYRMPVVESIDCVGCPLKVETGSNGEPLLPNKIQQLKNLATDVKDIAASGLKTVSRRCYNERIMTCHGCPMYRHGRCAVCSCNVAAKAAFAVEQCPLNFWAHIPADVQPSDVLPPPVATPADLKDEQPPAEAYVPTEEYERRTRVCEGCEFRRGRRCNGCSCDLYTMARLTNSKCPKDKW